MICVYTVSYRIMLQNIVVTLRGQKKVPPVPIRPSVAMDIGGGSNEDDLTVKLQEIIDVNASVKAALDNGANVKMIMENWDFLQVISKAVYIYIRMMMKRL